MRLLVQRPIFHEMQNPGGPPRAYEYRVVEMPDYPDRGAGETYAAVTLTPDEHVIAVLE
jgi:hypothetical protein